VILNNNDGWVVEEAIKPRSCTPKVPDPVRYHGIDGWDEQGKALPRDSNEYGQLLSEFSCRGWG
jgi:hypothetical protein